MQESASLFQMIFLLSVWILIFIIMKPSFYYPYKVVKQNRNVAIFLTLIFCLYPFWGGDYFHYKSMFFEYKAGEYIPLEYPYKWIMDHLPSSYVLFRFVVWGGALLILFRVYKTIALNYDLCLFFFMTMYLPWFSYARVSLAMSLLILGLTMMVSPNYGKYRRRKFIGLLILLASGFFHRSAFIGMIAAVGALFLLNLNKKRLFLILMSFPFLVLLMQFVINKFMLIDLDYDTFITVNHRNLYLNNTDDIQAISGWGERISNFLTRTPLILIGYLYILTVYKGYYKSMPKTIRAISSYAFIIILIAIVFSFDLGYSTYVLYYRTLTFAMIPSAVFLSYIREQKIKLSKLNNIVYYMGILSAFYALLYTTYCTIVA